ILPLAAVSDRSCPNAAPTRIGIERGALYAEKLRRFGRIEPIAVACILHCRTLIDEYTLINPMHESTLRPEGGFYAPRIDRLRLGRSRGRRHPAQLGGRRERTPRDPRLRARGSRRTPALLGRLRPALERCP